MEIENAVIDSVWLGIEDHGILSVCIMLSGPSWGQGYGHYSIEGGYNAAGCIRGLLETFKVESFDKLKGCHARVRREYGLSSQITRVGHFLEDRWFDFKDYWPPTAT